MRRSVAIGVAVLVATAAAGAAGAGEAPSSAAEVFERLKSLDGVWTGKAAGEGAAAGEAHPATHEFRTTAAGSVVMEVMAPGSEDEMINMYHLDGEDLVVTHYCAGGNQPMMKLDRSALAEGRVEFGFAGGMNLDPSKDGHIHAGAFTELGADRIESRWTSWYEGQEAGAMVFELERQD